MDKLIERLQKHKFDTTILANGGITIQPTQRNKLKTEVMQMLQKTLATTFVDNANVELTSDGICISFYNEALDNEISLIINPVIKNLDYDPEFEAEEYARVAKQKKQEKQERELKKQKKIQYDAKIRKEALLLKQQKGEI